MLIVNWCCLNAPCNCLWLLYEDYIVILFWIPSTKGQLFGKHFHIMTSSYYCLNIHIRSDALKCDCHINHATCVPVIQHTLCPVGVPGTSFSVDSINPRNNTGGNDSSLSHPLPRTSGNCDQCSQPMWQNCWGITDLSAQPLHPLTHWGWTRWLPQFQVHFLEWKHLNLR